MNQNVKYQFFVSSTYKDLQHERAAVQHAILSAGHFPVGMELFPGTDRKSWKLIERSINDCDYFICILGTCYGTVDPDSQLSYTEMEYNYAQSIKKPTIVFVSGKSRPAIPEHSEQDPSKLKKLSLFREQVTCTGREVKFWNDANELKFFALQSILFEIGDNPQQGWIRNEGISKLELYEENKKLLQRISSLEGIVENLNNSNKLPEFDRNIYFTVEVTRKTGKPEMISIPYGNIIQMIVRFCDSGIGMDAINTLLIRECINEADAQMRANSIKRSDIRAIGRKLVIDGLIEPFPAQKTYIWKATKTAFQIYEEYFEDPDNLDS